jgi:hypothetical protein
VKTSVKGLRMSRDSRGVVFDLPSDLSDVVKVVHVSARILSLSFPLPPSLPPSLSLSLPLSLPPSLSLSLSPSLPPCLSLISHWFY